MEPSNLTPPPLGAHEIATARWGTRKVVELVLVLLGVVVFLILDLGTDLARSIGGLGLAMICIASGALIYFPLSRAALAWVDRRIQRLGQRPG